jgi:hypothetical protein
MTTDHAITILGVNRAQWELRNMVQALTMAPWLNTEKDLQRLEAAKFVLRHWRKFNAACNAERDLMFR